MASKVIPANARLRCISQRLNICYADVRLAVTKRDAGVIGCLARVQRDLGADYLDLCAAGLAEERDALVWMVQTVQREIDCPVAIDSANADAILAAFDICDRPPIVNALSVSHLKTRNGRYVMSLPADAFVISTFDPQTSNSPTDRIASLREVMRGMAHVRTPALIADPLFYPHSHDVHRWRESCSVAHEMQTIWPELGLLCAVGNVTFQAREGDRTHTEVAVDAVAEGFDWILCDMAKLAQGTRGTRAGTGQAGAIVL